MKNTGLSILSRTAEGGPTAHAYVYPFSSAVGNTRIAAKPFAGIDKHQQQQGPEKPGEIACMPIL